MDSTIYKTEVYPAPRHCRDQWPTLHCMIAPALLREIVHYLDHCDRKVPSQQHSILTKDKKLSYRRETARQLRMSI